MAAVAALGRRLAREHFGRLPKQCLMSVDDVFCEFAVDVSMLVSFVIRDELFRRLAQQHRVAKLDRLVAATTLDQFGVRLEDAEHAVAGGNGFPCIPTRRLAHDLLHRR